MTEGSKGDDQVPVRGSQAFIFAEGKLPEAALWLPHGDGTLITCDAVQNTVHFCDHPYTTFPVACFLWFGGFFGRAVVGPAWRDLMKKPGQKFDYYLPDFNRLMKLPFTRLIPGHGHPIVANASQEVVEGLKRAFTPRSKWRKTVIRLVQVLIVILLLLAFLPYVR